jgi:NADH dehydrogenase [ubiquinone] 1 alpha subcomplex assembly factor 7
MFDTLLPLDVFFTLSVEKYYRNNNPIPNDFITGPEASQMFCHSVAIWLYKTIYNYENDICLVEIGGGNGTLMDEILTCLSNQYIFKNVYFVEVSEKMVERQKKAVAKHINRNFHWVKSLDEIPESNYILIANEFFDTLPIKQFIKSDSGFREIYISPSMELIQSQEIISNELIREIFNYSKVDIESLNVGDILELSTTSLAILDTICKRAAAALIIDYGYYNPSKTNTIKAIANHKILDSFLVTPGTADVSAEVDFGSMEIFIKRNYPKFDIQYTTQKVFLQNNYIDVIAGKARKEAKTEDEINIVQSELDKILVDMGEKFKALSLCKKTPK